jgi:hypothetical protein
MILFQKERMDLWSSRDAQKYLKKNDLIILPVGCFEMHGPDIPLGCDTFIDYSMSLLLAREWKCPCLPPVYYTYPGASGPWPGTVDIPARVTQEYITAIIYALLKNGFKRVALVGSHGPLKNMLGSVTGDIFQATGIAVVHVTPYYPIMEKIKEAKLPFGEDGVVLGALEILGLRGAYDPASKMDRPIEFPNRNIGPLRKCSANAPWLFAHDYQHTGIRRKLTLGHAQQLAKILEQAARGMKDLPKHFRNYQHDTQELFRKRPWNKTTVWTKTK